MSDNYTIIFTKRAKKDISGAQRWWRANRTKAPDCLAEEFQTALDTISSNPGIGSVAGDVELPGVRRILLNRVHYFLYYRHDRDRRIVEVVALWHARRGTPPKL